MNFLLDTNVALLAMSVPERLTPAVRRAIQSGQNVLSVITYWEVLLKALKGKLIDVGDPRAWWETALSDFAATTLPLRPAHITKLYSLASIHQDPFDRALISQAIVEDLTILTTDGEIPKYVVDGLRVIR